MLRSGRIFLGGFKGLTMLSPGELDAMEAAIKKAPTALLLDTESLFRIFRAYRTALEKLGKKAPGEFSDDWDFAEVLAHSPKNLMEAISDLRGTQLTLARFESGNPELGDLSFREMLRSALITKLMEENREMASELGLIKTRLATVAK